MVFITNTGPHLTHPQQQLEDLSTSSESSIEFEENLCNYLSSCAHLHIQKTTTTHLFLTLQNCAEENVSLVL